MKRLICSKDVEDFSKQGKKVYYIDHDTIITPAAEDTASSNGIQFSIKSNCCDEKKLPLPKAGESELNSDMIYTVLKAMASL